jgi:hypothetical protein
MKKVDVKWRRPLKALVDIYQVPYEEKKGGPSGESLHPLGFREANFYHPFPYFLCKEDDSSQGPQAHKRRYSVTDSNQGELIINMCFCSTPNQISMSYVCFCWGLWGYILISIFISSYSMLICHVSIDWHRFISFFLALHQVLIKIAGNVKQIIYLAKHIHVSTDFHNLLASFWPYISS